MPKPKNRQKSIKEGLRTDGLRSFATTAAVRSWLVDIVMQRNYVASVRDGTAVRFKMRATDSDDFCSVGRNKETLAFFSGYLQLEDPLTLREGSK
jgi:hypothetical protein